MTLCAYPGLAERISALVCPNSTIPKPSAVPVPTAARKWWPRVTCLASTRTAARAVQRFSRTTTPSTTRGAAYRPASPLCYWSRTRRSRGTTAGSTSSLRRTRRRSVSRKIVWWDVTGNSFDVCRNALVTAGVVCRFFLNIGRYTYDTEPSLII